MKNNDAPCKSHFSISTKFCRVLTGLLLTLAVAAPALGDVTQTAVVATVDSGYTSSAVAVIPVDAEDGSRTTQDSLLAQSNSDITLSAYGEYFYLLTRSNSHTVAKIHIDDPDTTVWQYSTEGDESGSNPHELVFVDSEKAYLIRYGSSTVWIVNPSAETEDDFKIGEIDLSAYNDVDSTPEMHSAVIADGKLFILMQRLDSTSYFAPTSAHPYIAVIDVDTDTEIDTGVGGTLSGIPLDVWDPMKIQYLEENETIYVQGFGYYPGYGYPDYEYEGGIVAIDPDDYSTTLILDDGDSTSHPYGNIWGMEIVSSTKGFFVGYDGWGDNTLYAFDPSADTPAGTAVTDLQNINIAGMDSGGTATDQNGILWVCNATDAQMELLDTDTDTVEESVVTVMNPSKVVFTEVSVSSDTDDDTDDSSTDDSDDSSDTDDSDDDDDDDNLCFIGSATDAAGFSGFPYGGLLACSLLALGAALRYRKE